MFAIKDVLKPMVIDRATVEIDTTNPEAAVRQEFENQCLVELDYRQMKRQSIVDKNQRTLLAMLAKANVTAYTPSSIRLYKFLAMVRQIFWSEEAVVRYIFGAIVVGILHLSLLCPGVPGAVKLAIHLVSGGGMVLFLLVRDIGWRTTALSEWDSKVPDEALRAALALKRECPKQDLPELSFRVRYLHEQAPTVDPMLIAEYGTYEAVIAVWY